MARNFVRTTVDQIKLNLGALNFAGPVTAAAIVRSTTDGSNLGWYRAGSGAGASIMLSTTTVNKLRYSNQSAQVDSPTITLVIADGWCLIAISKASGTAAPRYHKYVFSSNAWTHESSGSTIADPTTPGTSAWIGSLGASTGWDGDIAVVGTWNAVLSDGQIESLPFSLKSWHQLAPKGLWLLDQQAITQKVHDLSGNGATENTLTNTTVSTASVPVFSYGAPSVKVDIQPAAVGGGGVAGPRDLLLLGAG